MKIILTTTLVALFAIGLLGINNNSSNSTSNAFAQINPENPPLLEDKNIGIMTMSN